MRRKPPRSLPPERRRRSPLTIRGSGRTSAGSPQRAQSSRSACCKQASMNQASKQLVRTAAAWERGATRSARTFVAPSGGLAIFLSSPSCGGSLAQSTSVEASRREGQKSPATQMSRAERVAGALAQVGAMRPPHGMARASKHLLRRPRRCTAGARRQTQRSNGPSRPPVARQRRRAGGARGESGRASRRVAGTRGEAPCRGSPDRIGTRAARPMAGKGGFARVRSRRSRRRWSPLW